VDRQKGRHVDKVADKMRQADITDIRTGRQPGMRRADRKADMWIR